MVDRYGTPFSAALHVAERYRLIDGTSARDLQQNHESVCFGAGKSSPPANPGSSWVSLRASGLKTRFLKVGPVYCGPPWLCGTTADLTELMGRPEMS